MKIYRDTLITMIIVTAVAWMSVQGVIVPQIKDIKVMKSSLLRNKERNERIHELAKKPYFFDDLMKKIGQYHSDVRDLLPKRMKLSGLLKELSLLAKTNEVSLVSIKPLGSENMVRDSEGQQETFIKSDIQIVLETDYESLGSYIESVENNNLTVMAIKDVRISLEESNDANSLKSVLTIEAFYKAG